MEGCYRRLWASCLSTAIMDAHRYFRKSKRGRAADDEQAVEWILSDSPREGGFIWVCDVLDLDQDFVRNGVFSKRG